MLEKYKVSTYFNMKVLLARRIYLCKHLRDGENIREVDLISHTQWEKGTAAVKYSVLNLEVDSSIVFNCCWLIHSDSANSHAL